MKTVVSALVISFMLSCYSTTQAFYTGSFSDTNFDMSWEACSRNGEVELKITMTGNDPGGWVGIGMTQHNGNGGSVGAHADVDLVGAWWDETEAKGCVVDMFAAGSTSPVCDPTNHRFSAGGGPMRDGYEYYGRCNFADVDIGGTNDLLDWSTYINPAGDFEAWFIRKADTGDVVTYGGQSNVQLDGNPALQGSSAYFSFAHFHEAPPTVAGFNDLNVIHCPDPKNCHWGHFESVFPFVRDPGTGPEGSCPVGYKHENPQITASYSPNHQVHWCHTAESALLHATTAGNQWWAESSCSQSTNYGSGSAAITDPTFECGIPCHKCPDAPNDGTRGIDDRVFYNEVPPTCSYSIPDSPPVCEVGVSELLQPPGDSSSRNPYSVLIIGGSIAAVPLVVFGAAALFRKRLAANRSKYGMTPVSPVSDKK